MSVSQERGCDKEIGGSMKSDSKEDRHWLQERSRLEKILLLVIFLTCVGLVILLVVLIVLATTSAAKKDDFCTNIECVKAASIIHDGLDMSVNPCDNFYEFACGGWMKKNVVPDDRSSYAIYSVLRDRIQIILKQLLEESIKEDDIESVVKTKNMYKSCINSSQIEERGTGVAIPLLNELGGWPILGNQPGGNWKEDDFSLTDLLRRIRRYYNIPYVYLYVYTDIRNSSQYIIYADNPGFIMPERKYYLRARDDRVMQAYEKFGASVAMEFGADKAMALDDMKEILNIEIDLANISLPAEERRDVRKLYNKFKIKELQDKFPESTKLNFTWLGYIQQLFQLEDVNITISGDDEIIVKDMGYYSRLFDVLEKYPKRAITNYAVWRIMKNRAYNLPERFKQHIGNFNEVIYGAKRLRPRWRDCVSYVVSNLGLPAGRLFVEKNFDEEAKSGVKDMIVNIRDEFLKILKELRWMDEETRGVAKEKVEYMDNRIGYDDDILDDSQLDRRYENVTIYPDTYFENVLTVLKRMTIDDLLSLRYKLYRLNWETAPSIVNAFYKSTNNRITGNLLHLPSMHTTAHSKTEYVSLNTAVSKYSLTYSKRTSSGSLSMELDGYIVFPAGILQPPYYHKDFPRYLNYGGIGTLIGHEITHGFDDRGRQFDKNGELNQWWKESAISKFKSLSKCFVNQYGNFSYPEAGGLNVNGIITLGENIADNGGMKQSYRAYRSYIASRGEEELGLPGVNLTGNQLFFVNFAQIRCAIMHQNDAINHLITGPHSPSRFRVIGTLQNLPQFAEVYKCPRGSYMNPEKTCDIW